MAGEGLVKLLQVAGAALGIPAAAAGTFAAYQNYFSTDVTCQKLRNNIIATMERSVAPETKRSLLRKDVNEFDKLCGEGDPDARTIFHAAVAVEHPAPAAAESGHATTADAAPATSVAQPDLSRRSPLQSVGLASTEAARGGAFSSAGSAWRRSTWRQRSSGAMCTAAPRDWAVWPPAEMRSCIRPFSDASTRWC